MTRRRNGKAVVKPTPIVLVDFEPKVTEVWGDPSWRVSNGGINGPSCVNSITTRRYRVTVELIDEPIEVLRERLTTLWLTSERNSHSWEGFKTAAAELGMPPFDMMTMGSKREKAR